VTELVGSEVPEAVPKEALRRIEVSSPAPQAVRYEWPSSLPPHVQPTLEVEAATSGRAEAPSSVEPLLAPSAVAVPVSLPSTAAAVSVPATAFDDEELVRQALQKYRAAYSGLDARLAQAVWPGVDRTALTRAFSGLESQELEFSACRVDLRGSTANAVCRGSASYVPKVGSREPRLESRVWDFALRKANGNWQIETARAQ
jgi:hypothetical protein